MISEDDRRLPSAPGVPNEACWIVFEITSFGEELEEGSECRLHSVQGDWRPWPAVLCVSEGFRGQVAGEELRGNLIDVGASAEPSIEGIEVPEVDSSGVQALAVCPKLGIKSTYGSCEPHLNHGPMNASVGEEVNSILRRFETLALFRAISWDLAESWPPQPRHLAAVARFWEDRG